MTKFLLSTIMAFTLFLSSAIVADDDKKAKPVADPVVSVTEHSGTFNGKKVSYTATAGETHLKNKDDEVTASIFSTSYVKKNTKDAGKRPVFFVYNGGPGSSSVWLHMGAFGPKKIVIPSDAKDDGAAPFNMQDNLDTILDVTDLVFIDPVGTGFSKAAGVGEGKDFWGVHEDAASIAQFIRIWLRENGRWQSPKYIGGESYGTTRSAALINQLEGRFDDVSINGIILISTILDFTIRDYQAGNEFGYVTNLPTMAATAQYHGKAGAGMSIADFVEEARVFAIEEYAPALMLGNRLGADRREKVLKKLAYFTGLSENYINNADLRVHYQRFNKELLRDEGLALGRLDSRYKGEEVDGVNDMPEVDPSFYGIDGAYTAALNHWVREELKFNPDREYTIIGGVGKWNWDLDPRASRPTYMNVAPYIGKAMRGNKDLRVFNAAGYYDFATPLMGAEYSLQRKGFDPERITYKYYPAGHMMYIHHPSMKVLLNDIRDFIKAD